MGRFTDHDDPRIDARVASDLERIGTVVRGVCPSLQALVLAGSFSRGEGSVLVDADGVRPINDYDLVVVRPDATHDPAVKAALRDMAPQLGFEHLDAQLTTRDELCREGPTMHAHDLAMSGQVLHGDPEFLSTIPAVPAQRVDFGAAQLLLFNRLTCMLQHLPDGWPLAPVQPADAWPVTYMIHKVVLAVVAAKLAAHGQYHHSAARRLSLFEDYCADRPDLMDLARRATRFKLRPTRQVPDPRPDWFRVRDHFLNTLREVTERSLRVPLPTWEVLMKHQHRDRWVNSLRRLKYRLIDPVRLRESLDSERRQDVELAEVFLLQALRPVDAPDQGALDQARQLVMRWSGWPGPTWLECARATVTLDLCHVHV